MKIAVAGAYPTPARGIDTVYHDRPYEQDYSIRYYPEDKTALLRRIVSDRNGNICVLSDRGLLKPHAGKLLYPGELVRDLSYRPLTDRKISGLALYEDQFVYLDNKAVFSNAWAGACYSAHDLPGAVLLAAGKDFNFLVSDGQQLELIHDGQNLWTGRSSAAILSIQYAPDTGLFWWITTHALGYFSPQKKAMVTVFSGDDFTCFKILDNTAWIGTHNGYLELDLATHKQRGQYHRHLPATDLTVIEQINNRLWFGSVKGAFMLRADGKFNYYASQRWLPGDRVTDIAKGEDGAVLVLTDKGLGKICFEKFSLEQKAAYYEEQVRQRHIRYGFYSDYSNIRNGDISTAETGPHDSDNLWTSMYLAGELFRWLVTHDESAKQNCLESLDAMERLTTLSGIPGLFGRCVERHGIVEFKNEYRKNIEDYWYPGYANTPSSWRQSPDKEWDWRGSASSDQAVGQYFALTLIAQYMDDKEVKERAIRLIDGLTGYILDNGLKLIDYNGRPTLWGIWAPEYVNRFPDMVGDKKLYSSNIISFLQTAWHFTGKEKYKDKALELLYKDHYLQNLTRPVSQIGPAPESADKWSKMLSGNWNNSDDEMYFLAYWGLYPYALNDTLRAAYGEAIRDHWNIKRPAKDALWNLCYAMTGARDFDLDETIWELKEMPLDLINWPLHNSDRKDLQFPKKIVRQQFVTEVLPPDERPENKHNRNLFTLNSSSNASAELGGGDVYLLPYWMGRYFGVISAPEESDQGLSEKQLTKKAW
ncbi:MAG: hypothetical protein Q8926_01880 [Bacteroidota bacterium]|nr:hypothetical protein [Bacteroidota bacterium]